MKDTVKGIVKYFGKYASLHSVTEMRRLKPHVLSCWDMFTLYSATFSGYGVGYQKSLVHTGVAFGMTVNNS